MGRIITLPGGVKFDPESGELIGADFRRPTIPSNSSYSYSSNNWWNSINNFVIGIGNWFAEHSSGITGGLAVILLAIGWIYFIVSVIGIWIEDGFFSALIFGIIGGVIFYYVSMIAAGILIWVGVVVLALIRYVFYNIYTLIISIVLIICIMQCNGQNNTSRSTNSIAATEVVHHQFYRCTARTVLNVRKEPNIHSSIIGKIKNGDMVEVTEINHTFAKIKYEDSYGYASMRYLQKMD